MNKSFFAAAGTVLVALLAAASHMEGGRVLSEQAKKAKAEDDAAKTVRVHFAKFWTLLCDKRGERRLEGFYELLESGLTGQRMVKSDIETVDGDNIFTIQLAVDDYYTPEVAKAIYKAVKEYDEATKANKAEAAKAK